MATKTKTSYTVNVYVHGIDDPIEVADSSTSNAGYQAYMDFKMGNVIKVPGDESDAYIPYHAVIMITVATSTSSETIVDDFCATEESE